MSQWQRAPDVMQEVVDGRAILMDPSGSEMITLNPVGTLIWGLLAKPTDLDSVVQSLASTFDDVDERTMRDDAEAFHAELVELGLLTEVATDPAGGHAP